MIINCFCLLIYFFILYSLIIIFIISNSTMHIQTFPITIIVLFIHVLSFNIRDANGYSIPIPTPTPNTHTSTSSSRSRRRNMIMMLYSSSLKGSPDGSSPPSSSTHDNKQTTTTKATTIFLTPSHQHRHQHRHQHQRQEKSRNMINSRRGFLGRTGGTAASTISSSLLLSFILLSSTTLSNPNPAHALKPKNDALCGTGFFEHIYEYKCTSIGDIEDEGQTKKLNGDEMDISNGLMGKLGLELGVVVEEGNSSSSGNTNNNGAKRTMMQAESKSQGQSGTN